MMRVERVFETVLYAEDLDAAESFYSTVLGLELVRRYGDLMLVFGCGQGVLLVFDPHQSIKPGRPRPSHGTIGPGHIAFGAQASEIDCWQAHLEAHDVQIEHIAADEEGRAIYFRDPAGNSIEIVPPTLWGGGWF
jgi:catechol 2,3-dioxygenase-like lactoylglutathione lyase family enzyme